MSNEAPTVTILSTATTQGDEVGEVSVKETPIRKPGTIVDALNRKIVVRALSPLEHYRLAKIMGVSADVEQARGYAMVVASVREFDGEPESFPNSDSEIEAMLQRLGNEGIQAVNQALGEYMAAKAASNKVAVKN